jgi:hypothetical protein
MIPLQQQRPVVHGDLMYNGWLSAMRGLIVKAQTGVGVRPDEGLAVAPGGDGAKGRWSATAERTAHGNLAPRR